MRLPEALAVIADYQKNHHYERVLRHRPDKADMMGRQGRYLASYDAPTPASKRDAEYLLALAPLAQLNTELAARRAANDPAYTTEAGWRGFPRRDPAASERELDLTPHFNMVLEAPTFGGEAKYNLRSLPKGLRTLDGVRFDVRGVVALAKKGMPNHRPYPARIEGIAVDRRAARLHMLHGCGWREKDGVTIGRYVLRYSDGETRELPIVYGEDLRGHNLGIDPTAPTAPAREAWRAPSEDVTIRLFHRAYDNPRPDAEIAALDFISTETEAAPFVVAITLE